MLYDYDSIEARRAEGESWASIAEDWSTTANNLRGLMSRRRRRSTERPEQANIEASDAAAVGADSARTESRTFTRSEIERITSLEDLLTFFDVDTDAWEVRDYRVNKWEQAAKSAEGDMVVTPLYQVRANLIPRLERRIEAVQEVCDEIVADALKHAPLYTTPVRRPRLADEPCLFELAINDPHIGMLAWGREVGKPYDSDIAVRDYADAVGYLLGFAELYPVERVLFVAGNDFLHVDGLGFGAKGGATTMGTGQDIDSRLDKMFTAGRRALIAAIDRARLIAPVDVLFVKGNHDSSQTYRMGEVVSAWYRNDSEVNVIYGPAKHTYYGYGRNAFMFTHGEGYKRTADRSLPLVFATECPAKLWVSSEGGSREIHTGHNHVRKEGRYVPTSDVDETRAIRTRSLPALTPEDAWHREQDYSHQRAANVLVWRKSGGCAGNHEFTL